MVDVVALDFPDKQIAILASGDWRGFRSNACQKEPETVEWIRSIERGKTFWDIGASVGSYSLIASCLGLKVYSFEPYGPSYGELCQNSLINQLETHPLPLAIGTGSRVQSIVTTAWQPGVAGESLNAKEGRPLPMMVVSADDMADQLGVPSHVKIDVDGHELSVIESGKALWPLVDSIMVECTRRTIEDVRLILSTCGLEQEGSWPRSGDESNYLFRKAVQ